MRHSYTLKVEDYKDGCDGHSFVYLIYLICDVITEIENL